MKVSLPPKSPPPSFTPQSNLSSSPSAFLFLGAGSFHRHAQFLSSPRWKNKLPVCSWLVVTPLDFWVCMEGGTRGREFPPPSLLFLSLTTEHCSCWATASTFPQSEWIPGGSGVMCGLLWSREGRWWGGGGGRAMWGFYGLSVRACVSTPTICSPQTQRQRHADTQ